MGREKNSVVRSKMLKCQLKKFGLKNKKRSLDLIVYTKLGCHRKVAKPLKSLTWQEITR